MSCTYLGIHIIIIHECWLYCVRFLQSFIIIIIIIITIFIRTQYPQTCTYGILNSQHVVFVLLLFPVLTRLFIYVVADGRPPQRHRLFLVRHGAHTEVSHLNWREGVECVQVRGRRQVDDLKEPSGFCTLELSHRFIDRSCVVCFCGNIAHE